MPLDQQGQELQEGDTVLVPFIVSSVAPSENQGNVALVASKSVRTFPGKVVFMTNSRNLLKTVPSVMIVFAFTLGLFCSPVHARSFWVVTKKRPAQAPPKSVWVVSAKQSLENPGKEVIPSRRTVVKTRRSDCQCSPACTCGCQDGSPCPCSSEPAATAPIPTYPAPAFFPAFGGFAGGGFGGGFGGGGGCSGGG